MDGKVTGEDILDFIVAKDIKKLMKSIGKFDVNSEIKDNDYLDFGSLIHHSIYALSATEEILDILLSEGANINKKNEKNGDTPLHVAIELEDTNTIRYLLNKGADYSIPNNDFLTPKEYALLINNYRSVNLIDFYKYEKIHFSGDTFNTSRREILRLMWDGKTKSDSFKIRCNSEYIDLNERISIFGPAIHTAIAIGQDISQVIDVLLNAGADINKEDHNGLSPLHICIKWNEYSVFKDLLLNKKANLNVKDRFNRTPLEFAKIYRRKSYMELIYQENIKTILKNETMREGLNTPFL